MEQLNLRRDRKAYEIALDHGVNISPFAHLTPVSFLEKGDVIKLKILSNLIYDLRVSIKPSSRHPRTSSRDHPARAA